MSFSPFLSLSSNYSRLFALRRKKEFLVFFLVLCRVQNNHICNKLENDWLWDLCFYAFHMYTLWKSLGNKSSHWNTDEFSILFNTVANLLLSPCLSLLQLTSLTLVFIRGNLVTEGVSPCFLIKQAISGCWDNRPQVRLQNWPIVCGQWDQLHKWDKRETHTECASHISTAQESVWCAYLAAVIVLRLSCCAYVRNIFQT